MSQANADHFNKEADSYDKSEQQQQMTRELQQHLQDNTSWLNLDASRTNSVSILDYACGPGAVSFGLQTYADEIVGVDVSSNMVQVFNDRAKQHGLSHLRAIVGNLCVAADETLSDEMQSLGNFDLVVVSLGFHHFDNPVKCIRQLIAPLKTGGRLVIIDFLSHEGFAKLFEQSSRDKNALGTIGKGAENGFSAEQITALFEQGGCRDVEVKPWRFQHVGGKFAQLHLFTCRGVKS